MGLTPAELARVASEAPEYRDALAAPGKAPGERVADALAAFETEALVPADAPIDRLARGDADALDAESSRGLDVFAGKALCTRCHVPPLFGGSRPRDFAVPVFAAIGVPDKPNGHSLDPDRGRASVTRREADAHAFKTPTVRDVARTAPYFHNGRFARLEDVVDFYDAGGGRGLGLEVHNQDPDVRKLELSAAEKRALLAFMRVALLDGSPPERAMIEKK
jgi:cytochrome c peroxidase